MRPFPGELRAKLEDQCCDLHDIAVDMPGEYLQILCQKSDVCFDVSLDLDRGVSPVYTEFFCFSLGSHSLHSTDEEFLHRLQFYLCHRNRSAL